MAGRSPSSHAFGKLHTLSPVSSTVCPLHSPFVATRTRPRFVAKSSGANARTTAAGSCMKIPRNPVVRTWKAM